MAESCYWLVGVKFKFVNVKGKIQEDERAWTVWADNTVTAQDSADYGWKNIRQNRGIIKDSLYWLTPRKLTQGEIKKMEAVFKK